MLRYLILGFAAFSVPAVLAHPDWPRLLTASLVLALALLGTTLTSYACVWETGRGLEQPSGATAQPSGQPGPAPSPAACSPP